MRSKLNETASVSGYALTLRVFLRRVAAVEVSPVLFKAGQKTSPS